MDDSEVNRRLLVRILAQDYEILEACDGRQALDTLAQHNREIAGIVLDLIMPEMDGYAFLERVSAMEAYHNLPVLVATADEGGEVENHCLKLGAWDFVRKPYNPATVRLRLQNIISRSQLYLMEQLRYLAEHDTLTGLYNREKFFQSARAMLDQHPEEQFAFIHFDIDRFRLINSFFGEEEGNRLLRFVSTQVQKISARFPYATYGRMEADVFCFCQPYRQEEFLELVKESCRLLREFTGQYYAEPTFGVYVIDDVALDVETMYARSSMAAERCKARHMQPYAYYDRSISDELFRTQSILNDMDTALAQRQFVVYFQPKYDLATERPYGAEALVRWQHPVKGLIPPSEFIPVFEHNGFISKVDYYVWEEVCRLLRKWMDEGRDIAPISVNVSRMNMYNPHLVDVLCGLLGRYGVPPRLLNLELTESAYMDNPDSMKETLTGLRAAGFTLMMDDFGSGYSSLNTLRDLSVDFLKIDMKFLPAGTADGRSERILASVIRMAGWLGLPVVVEGVETKAQRDFLKGVGCGYVQGYFYARPMPAEEYEALIRAERPGNPPMSLTEEVCFALENIWKTGPQQDLLLQHITQPLLLYEVTPQEVELLRVNQAYLDRMCDSQDFLSLGQLCQKYISQGYWSSVEACIRAVVEEKRLQVVEYERNTTGGPIWLRAEVQYLCQMPASHLVLVTLTDITREKALEAEVHRLRGDAAKQP